MSNHQVRGLAATGTKGSFLRKALSYFLAIMLAVTLIPLASIGAPEEGIVEPFDSGLDLLGEGEATEEGEAAEEQGQEAPALEAVGPSSEPEAPALEAVDPEVIIAPPALDPTGPAVNPTNPIVNPVGPVVQAPELEAVNPSENEDGEFANIMPLAITPLGPGECEIDTWADLRSVIGNAAYHTVFLKNDITHDGTNLPAITRSLTINGRGNTMSWAANTAIAISVTGNTAKTVKLENLTIARNTSANWLINAGTAQNTTIVLDRVNAPTLNSPIAQATGAGSAINIINSVITADRNTSADTMINGIALYFSGAQTRVYIRSQGADNIALETANSANVLSVKEGAQVEVINTGSGSQTAISMRNNYGNSTRDLIIDGAGSSLIVRGSAGNTGDDAGVIILRSSIARNPNIMVSGGAYFNSISTRPNDSVPAILIRGQGSSFIADGEGTKFEAESFGSSNNRAGTIRFRQSGNDNTFLARNGAELNIYKRANTGGEYASVIRFGSGSNNNTFAVESGARMNIINEGNNRVATSSNDRNANACVEFDGATWEFRVTGENSSLNMRSAMGAVLASGQYAGGKVIVGEGTIFTATGNMNSTTNAIFAGNTGTNGMNFTMTNPLYYDFVNINDGNSGRGRQVFSGQGLYTHTNSDLAVWGNGDHSRPNNNIQGDPYEHWTMLTMQLRGNGYSTIVPGSFDWPQFPQEFGNSMAAYKRINGNNAAPQIRQSYEATNADMYVRWRGITPEGLDQDQRPFWTNEVWADIRRDSAAGGSNEVKGTSFNQDPIYLEEQGVDTLRGVVRHGTEGTFLIAGDTYTMTNYYRAEAADTDTRYQRPGDASLAAPIVVKDVVPPLPATSINPSPFSANQRTLSGTWALAPNDNPPVSVKAVLKRGAETSELPGTGVVNANNTWTFTLGSAALQEGDQIFIVFTDENDNEQPLVDTPKRDMMIPAAASVMVQAAGTAITGVLFTDEDRNGYFSNGDQRLADKEVLLYTAGNLTTPIDTTTTAADGSYYFSVDPGSYVIKAPAHPGYGYTSLITIGRTPGTIYSDVNNNGFSGTLTVNNDNEANLVKEANAGYAIPIKPDPDDPNAFTKDLVKVGGEATNGPIHDSTADLTYEISYKMPDNTAGYNQMTLLDIMDPGLVLKDGNTANIQVRAVAADGTTTIPVTGTAAYAAGTGELAGTMVASYTLADSTNYVALAGATIIMTVTAKLEKVDNAWPTLVTNKARLLVNNSSDPFVDDEENEERNVGLISGFAFIDENSNGSFDVSEKGIDGLAVTLKVWNGTEYVAYTPAADDMAVTNALGAYKFEVPAGLYRIEFPVRYDDMGITTSAPNANASGVVDAIQITLGTAAEQTRTIHAGYFSTESPVINFLDYPLVVAQTPLVTNVMTKDALCAALTVTDAEDYPTWTSDAD
ncbi:MAG: isopeptide-forming domain-containing fimbrial protein, partial [Coriobacteriia bacterium]|nr:isopeptide-forming domain-containing fimbrial protein [Coriobacteriia bacterium]